MKNFRNHSILRSLAGLAALAFGTVVSATSLSVDEDVVVKFGPDAGLTVRQELNTSRHVVFTSLADDSAAGRTGTATGVPAAGDWRGLTVAASVVAQRLNLHGLSMRYAGASGSAALDLMGSYALDALSIADSTLGIHIGGGASPNFQQLSLLRNGIGMQSDGATPQVSQSEIRGNLQFGILNMTPASLVQASSNWWGAASGPNDAINNPAGAGDKVSEGVVYIGALAAQPLLDCSIAVADGNYTRSQPNVDVSLECRNATQFRLAASNDFSAASYAPIAAIGSFMLTGDAGAKQIFVQYSNGSVSVIASLPQPITYTPGAPDVGFVTPAENVDVYDDVQLEASASDVAGISGVEFFVDSHSLGTVQTPPYRKTWAIAGYSFGPHLLKAVAKNLPGVTSQAIRHITLRSNDVTGPVIDDLRFNNALLDAEPTFTTGGVLSARVIDPVGVASVSVTIDSTPMPGGFSGSRYLATLNFDDVADGQHNLNLVATDAVGNATPLTLIVHVAIPAPSAPAIVAPADGSSTIQPGIGISGTAAAGSHVQVYVDGAAAGDPVLASSNGSFAATATLAGEGPHALTARASNGRGTSPISAAVNVTYLAPVPSVLITAPPAAATIGDAGADFDVSVIDVAGVQQVEFFDGARALGTKTQAPYSVHWSVTAADNGPHTLRAKATNVIGKTAEASVNVLVQTTPPPPVIPPTPYTGEIQSALPALSYGEQPIVILGRAVDRTTQALVPNALLKLTFKVNGFTRKINVVTDATGAFTYRMVPQGSDAGTYQVAALHPDETTFASQQQFSINRLTVNPGQINLHGAFTVESVVGINVAASAGSGVTGVHFVATLPSGDDPSTLFDNAHFEPASVNIAGGASTLVNFKFTPKANIGESGTLILDAYADGASVSRGKVIINYTLSPPHASLYPSPQSVQTGVQRGHRISGVIQLQNRGLAAAHGLQASLQQAPNCDPVPGWISLESGANIGTLDVGASVPIQFGVAPPASEEADHLYCFNVHITATDGSGTGDVLVGAAVVHDGQGSGRFHVIDIYTNYTPGVVGLAGATVRVQNQDLYDEGLYNEQILPLTDVNGLTTSEQLSPGYYRFRATAPNHGETTGHFTVHPIIAGSGTHDEVTVFLDYQVISFEWSVTETTIPDHYDVTLTATYQTEVPAPVLLIEPSSINLPDLQVGEEFTGEITISNYGLLRADNVIFHPAVSDAYYKVEYLGTVPDHLDARSCITPGCTSRVRLGYKITLLQALPGTDTASGRPASLLARATGQGHAAMTTSGSCYGISKPMSVEFGFTCSAGVESHGSSNAGFNKAYGQTCGSSSGGTTWIGGSGGPDAGGWGGAGGGPSGAPMAAGPGCTPDCKKCCHGGSSSGGN